MSVVKTSHTRLSSEYHLQHQADRPQHKRTNSVLSERSNLVGRRSNSRNSNASRRRVRTDKAFLRSRVWWLGQVFLTLGEIGNFVGASRSRDSIDLFIDGEIEFLDGVWISSSQYGDSLRLDSTAGTSNNQSRLPGRSESLLLRVLDLKSPR